MYPNILGVIIIMLYCAACLCVGLECADLFFFSKSCLWKLPHLLITVGPHQEHEACEVCEVSILATFIE